MEHRYDDARERSRSRVAWIAILAVAMVGAGALVACGGGSYPRGPVTTPAPAGALECALRFMGEANYTPEEGGVASGFIKFTQPDPSRILTAGMRYREVTVSVAVGQMRIVATGDRESQAQARSLAIACGSPP